MVRIAIDAMGGDNAPKEIVQGVVLAAKEMPTVEFQLYGDEAKSERMLGGIPSKYSRDSLFRKNQL